MSKDTLENIYGFLPKEQEFFLDELLLESYMSNSEIFSMSRALGYTVEFRQFYCTLLIPENLTPELAFQNKRSRFQLFHDAAQMLGEFCGLNSIYEFQMISAALGKEIVLLTSVPLLKTKAAEKQAQQKLTGLLDQFMASCNTQYGLILRASTSLPLYLDNISLAYSQAKELAGFITMLSLPNRNLFYDDVVFNGWERNDAKHLARTKQWESAYLNALERNDFHRLQELLHEMADEEFRYGSITIQASSAVLYTLLNKFRVVLDTMRPFAGTDVLEVFDTAPRILYRKSLSEVMESIDMIFQSFFSSQDTTGNQSLPVWVLRMDAYISEHFTDPDLNVSTLSSHFGLCAAYAGRTYKDLMGYSVLDRINHLRIERACSLLQQNMLLKDVAVAVGYENRQRMNRAFLKYAGYPPKEAKDVIRDNITE